VDVTGRVSVSKMYGRDDDKISETRDCSDGLGMLDRHVNELHETKWQEISTFRNCQKANHGKCVAMSSADVIVNVPD
jgi:hypothetical protein